MIPLLLACSEPSPPPVEQKLAEASEEVIFASVENLGPHLYLSTLVREELRGERLESRHVEAAEILWEDWDNFSHRRLVDGRPVSELVVVEHRAWKRRAAGEWSRKADAEPYRVQLRSSWNAWEQAIAPFQDAIEWESVAIEELEGRETQRYRIFLAEGEKDAVRSRGLVPVSLEGEVWVDKATAVRILGEARGELSDDGYRRQFTIKVSRSQIGQEQGISPPGVVKDQRLTPEGDGL